jgi:cell division septum initiation protein DivIVA
MDRFDRKNLTDSTFDVVLRGYDKRQVDERLGFLGAELRAAEDAHRATTQRVAMLEKALSQAQSQPSSNPVGEVNFGARVEKILKLAEEEAAEVRSQAEAAAMALLGQAQVQVDQLRERAEEEIAAWRTQASRPTCELDSAHHELEQEAERIRAQAHADAEQIRTALAAEVEQVRTAGRAEAEELLRVATADAEKLGKAARTAADQLLARARTEAERLVAAATEAARQRERSSAHELHQLSRLQEEIHADLYRVKDLLDSLFGAGGTITGVIRHRLRKKDGTQPAQPAGGSVTIAPTRAKMQVE